MRLFHARPARKGTIVPLLAMTVVAVFALVALAVDIGLMALARTHCQNAADAGAMAAVRQLNGKDTDNNKAAADPTAKLLAKSNKILNADITDAMVKTEVGYYAYNSTLQRFEADLSGTKPASESWTSVRVTINASQPMFFARVIGMSSLPAGATATAVHRPRDLALVLDFSGSMKYSSEPAYPSSGTISGSLNSDTRYPKFGHYSASSIANTMYRSTDYVDGGGETHAINNFTKTSDNGPPIVRDFLWRNPSNSNALEDAFHRTSASYNWQSRTDKWACPAPDNWDVQSDTTAMYGGASGKGGDLAPRYNKSFTTGSYAATVSQFLKGDDTLGTTKSTITGPGGGRFDPDTPSTPTDTQGYGADFRGYSMGPGYYGKTFFMWPPDPRFHPSAATASPETGTDPKAKDTTGRWMGDWRKRFFYNGGTTTPLNGDNTRLWDTSTEQWKQASSSTYSVNYNAILAWIKSGPQTLPANLRAGRVLYYTSIPSDVNTGSGSDDEKADKRFWRSYIDYVIGNGDDTMQRRTGYGRQPDDDDSFGTSRITERSTLGGADGTVGNSDDPYMHYRDNPVRPRLQFWFGPLSMLCYLSDNNSSLFARNWMPGTSHESQCWQLKAGVNSALDDVKKNHPNDLVSLIYFSGLQGYATERVALGRDYTKMKNALFFPFNTLNNLSTLTYEVRPYDDNLNDTAAGNVPNANGSTSPECGLKLAYNQLSSRSGYNGRRGASKVVILESDGVPNTRTTGSLTLGSPAAYNSHYTGLDVGANIGNGESTVLSNAKAVAAQIVALDSASPPGYSSARLPARIHSIAFGDLFETTGSTKVEALTFLLDIEKIGGTSPSTATSLPSYKIVTGNYTTRVENLRQSLERIFQSGVQVSLIK